MTHDEWLRTVADRAKGYVHMRAERRAPMSKFSVRVETEHERIRQRRYMRALERRLATLSGLQHISTRRVIATARGCYNLVIDGAVNSD
jgi:hypothetical protein